MDVGRKQRQSSDQNKVGYAFPARRIQRGTKGRHLDPLYRDVANHIRIGAPLEGKHVEVSAGLPARSDDLTGKRTGAGNNAELIHLARLLADRSRGWNRSV